MRKLSKEIHKRLLEDVKYGKYIRYITHIFGVDKKMICKVFKQNNKKTINVAKDTKKNIICKEGKTCSMYNK